MSALAAYGSLFLAAFLAATILPAQSEALLAGLLAMGDYAPALLIQMCAHLPLHWHGLNFETNLGAAETLIRAHTTRQLPN